MACEPAASWEPLVQSSNSMEQQNLDIITSALFGDSSVMLSAVASLLTRHHCNKEHDALGTSPQRNLTNTPSKDSVLADAILGTARIKSGVSKAAASHVTENLIPSFEQVHALATANLVASTQLDIAKQLAEANRPSQAGPAAKQTKLNARKEPHQDQQDTLKKSKSENQRKVDKKRTCSKLAVEQSITAIVDEKSSFSETKALICSYEGCNRKFAWLNHLKYHELTHTNNRQFKCPEDSCGKTFFTAQRLSVHQRTHTGEKPFRCLHQDCGKTFTTAGNLKNHQRIHTGEQPFVCDHANCSRRFTEQSSLRKHKLTHSGDKPFECKICGKKFTQSGSRRQHLIRHHLDDEIRHSFKHEGTEKDGEEEDDMVSDERKEAIRTSSSCSHALQTDPVAISAVSCSPQVLVLNNTYPSLSSAESIVLSHGLSDHLVTVKTEVMDHPMSEPQSISLSHTLLSSDGFHDAVLHEKSDDFVVLSEAPIYDHDDSPADIVYTTDILGHEEVTHADYVGSHIDYTGESTHSNYSSHRGLTHSDDFTHPEFSHPDNYITHAGDIAVAEYVAAECVPQDSGFTDSKSVPHSYLDSDRDVVHTEFIGAEEVTTAQHSSNPGSDPSFIENSSVECSQGRATALTDYVRHHYPGKLDSFTLGKATFIGHPSCHLDSSFMLDSAASDTGHSLVVVEVTGHASQIIHADSVGRNMRMDPLMECDEEPDRHHFLPVS